MSFHRFKIFPLKNNKFNIINVNCSLHSLKREGRYLSLKPCLDSQKRCKPPDGVSRWLEWQHLVTILKRSIYTSLVKYQILKKKEKKDLQQSLVAFLDVQGQQEGVLHAVDNIHDPGSIPGAEGERASGWLRFGFVGRFVLNPL